MRTFISIVFIIIPQYAYGNGHDIHRIRLDMKDTTIREILAGIEKKTDYYFMYDATRVDVDQKIDLVADNLSVEEILDRISELTGINYKISGRQIALNYSGSPPLPASRNITGRVTDRYLDPLPGTSVIIKNSTTGTVTDLDGCFTLQDVPGDAILVFSFIGMRTKEVAPGNSSALEIILNEDAFVLEEIVAVGYGINKKETLSGSIISIPSARIVTTRSHSLIGNLQGKLPGLHIRQQTHEPGVFNSLMSIRGFGQPLIIIDGVARDGTGELEKLNSEDVENIYILKDASAAIFGLNADNGVIIVTTKGGHAGTTSFNFFTNSGIKGPTGMEETVDAYTYRVMRNEMERNVGHPPQFSEDILEKYRLGTEPGYQDHNWRELFLYDWVHQQKHFLSVSGGSELIQHYTSLGYTEDNGILKSDIQKYRKYDFRTSITSNLSPNLKGRVIMAGLYDHNTSPRQEFQWVYKPIMINDRGYNYHTINDSGKLSLIPPENTNPWALMNPDIDGYRKDSNLKFQGTVDLSYSLPSVDGLRFNLLGALDGRLTSASQLILSYYQYDYYTGKQGPRMNGLSQYLESNTLFNRLNLQAQAVYETSINKTHNFKGMLVHEIYYTSTQFLHGSRQYDDLFTSDIISMGSLTNLYNEGYRLQTATASYLGRLNYDFRRKYMVEAAFRYDGTYRYAPSRRWGFFPSFSAAWCLSEEPFFRDRLPFVTHMKIRGSYGKMGADTGNPFEYISAYQFDIDGGGYVFNPGVMTTGMVPPGVVNSNLTWVSTMTANIGMDINLWDGKLAGSFDIFQKNRDGLLATRTMSVPNTFGAAFPQENINSDLIHGFDFIVSHRNRVSGITFEASANLTFSRRFLRHTESAPYSSSWQMWKDPLGSNRYVGRRWAYDYDGRYETLEQLETAPLMGGTHGNSRMLPGSWAIEDVNGDGIINSNDMLPMLWAGQSQGIANNPPLQFGMNLFAAWKNLDLNILLQGAALYTKNYRNTDIWGYGRYPSLMTKYLDRWHTESPDDDPYDPATKWIPGKYPALRSNFTGTTDGIVIDQWVVPANYLRLKTIEIGYTLPSRMTGKLNSENIRVYLNGFNLVTWSNPNLKQTDPEREEGEWQADLLYPILRSYNIGINMRF